MKVDPSKHGTKASDELLRNERTRHEVVGALFERGNAFVEAVASAKHDNRAAVAGEPQVGA